MGKEFDKNDLLQPLGVLLVFPPWRFGFVPKRGQPVLASQ